MSDSSLSVKRAIDVAGVSAAVAEVLEIKDRGGTLDASTPLASMPELDSLAVLELVVELEQRFDITIEDDDVTAEVFDTVGSLAAFLEAKAR